MKNKTIILFMLAVLVLAIGSCVKPDKLTKREPHLPAVPYHYTVASMTIIIPPGNPYQNGGNDTALLDNTPTANPTTDAGAALGRVLFYENMLSLNNSISCGSCHKQQNAFADNVPVSLGYNHQKGTRNAIALANLNMNSNYFWDGRVNSLESQSIMPVENHAEMGISNLDEIIVKLQSASYYPPLFQAAFGSPQITKQGVVYALAQFMRSMHTFNSKFDQGAASGFSNFTDQERNGELIFRQKGCANCHGGNNLDNGGRGHDHSMPAGNDWANGGLDMTNPDPGLMTVTGKPGDNGVFKVPTLRNVALSAPYMHDGRFQTLDQVVEHYNTGIQNNPNLDTRLIQNNMVIVDSLGIETTTTARPTTKLNLTARQKANLVAFLNTLTDYTFVADPKFADPFK